MRCDGIQSGQVAVEVAVEVAVRVAAGSPSYNKGAEVAAGSPSYKSEDFTKAKLSMLNEYT